MTTIPLRINHIRPVIEAVLNQSVHVEAIEINVPFLCVRNNTPYVIPAWLEEISGVRIFRTPDYGAITKIAPTLQRYSYNDDTYIWSVDDDCAYPPNQLALLLQAYRPNLPRILTRYGGALNNGYDRQSWYGEGPVTLLEGFGGVLYPPGCIGADFMDYVITTSLNEDCRRSDDVVLSMYFNRRGVEIYLYNKPTYEVPYLVNGFLSHSKIDALSAGGNEERYGRVFQFISSSQHSNDSRSQQPNDSGPIASR